MRSRGYAPVVAGEAVTKPEGPEEHAASEIVSAVTGCVSRRLDPGGGKTQLADYILIGSDGAEIGLLEVTSITDKRRENFWSPRTKKHRYWKDPRLKQLWLVTVAHTGVRLERVRPAVTPVLIELEAAGTTFACSDPLLYRTTVVALGDELRNLGVVELNALAERPGTEGGAMVNIMPTGGAYGIESLTSAIEAVARDEGNLTKLRRALDRRELFVWLNPPSSALSALTTFCDEPFRGDVAVARPPNLRAELTAVWAAAWPRDPGRSLALALWRADRQGWAVLEPPLVRS